MDDHKLTDVSNAKPPAGPEAAPQSTAEGSVSDSGARDLSGTVLGGYQLVRRIAEGGMGVVYEAIQLNLSRRVAVKILSEELAARPEFVQRFQREAKAAAALNHPNMVQVHDFCQTAGRCCLVMEYVEGQDLADYAEEQGKLSVLAALEIIEQAALALKAACEKSIVHRDIKPSNLLLTRDGQVKVSDLGLAKILTEASDLTMTGVGMGSPYFMAPEQASDARQVDHRVDIYSLGLTLLYLLTGKRPFDGNTPFSIVLAHSNRPLPRGADLGTQLPAEVERLIQKMSAKNPQDRYADYDALLADLRRVKAGQAPAFDIAAVRRKYLSPKAAFATTTLLALCLAVAALVSSRSKTSAPPKQSSPEPGRTGPAVFSDLPGPRPAAERERFGPPDDLPEGPPPEGAEAPGNRPFEEPPNRGEAGIPLPFGRLPRPTRSPLEDGTVQAMLAQADAYAAAHPQNFREMIDWYRQVLSKARGTPEAAEVNQKMDQVIDQHQAAIHKALREYELKMDELLQANKPQEAYDVWRDFPQNLRTVQSDQQISQLLRRKLGPSFVPK